MLRYSRTPLYDRIHRTLSAWKHRQCFVEQHSRRSALIVMTVLLADGWNVIRFTHVG